MKNRYCLILAVILFGLCSSCKSTKHSKPNIIFITVDDLNDWVGVMGGHPQTSTPNIDRLASNGMFFSNAHAQTAICNPSRSSFMTSMYPSSTGIYFNSGRIDESKTAKKNVVLTKRFEKGGYYVTGAGKLFHSGSDGLYIENHAGHFGGFGPLPEQKLSSYSGHRLRDWGVYPENDDQTPDYKIAEWGTKQIGVNHDSPLFLGLGFYRPHVPFYAPQKWFDLHPLDTIKLPKTNPNDLKDISTYAIKLASLNKPPHDWVLMNNQWSKLVQSYLASVSFVDHQIGKVLDTLENSSYKDNTYVILFSDHGFHLGEKELWSKQTLWETSTHVPLIITGPGIPQGKVCDKPVELLDIYPTLLELTGLETDPNLEGNSLVPLLKNPKAEWPHIARSSFGPGNYAIRTENYRYIHFNDGSEEFYDHTKDPHEWDNQINNPEYSNIIKKLKAFEPEKYHSILGSGSTGHEAYKVAEEFRK
ncbi:MAG: sulfatase [Balneolaceae bacterium]|nr:sulfatase [Balneolaceae bacterium]